MSLYNYKTTKYFVEKNLPFQLLSFKDKSIPSNELKEDLSRIDDKNALNSFINDKPVNWRFLKGDVSGWEEEFIEWKKYMLLIEIRKEVTPLFLDSLEMCNSSKIIKPYDEDDLANLTVDDECLVDLYDFIKYEIENKIKCKYTICLPIRDEMLHERILLSFYSLKGCPNVKIKVRLDPLIRYPEYSGSFERLYGKKINWEELSNTEENIHADFVDYETGVKTQIFWKKINDEELQFYCEELPLYDEINERGSRFYHAIYNVKTKLITHFDASTIIYSELEFYERNNVKLWDLSHKLGKYCKIYRIYGDINRDLFTSMVTNYFVRNNDIKKYFDELNEGL